jgi:hypothetical protein
MTTEALSRRSWPLLLLLVSVASAGAWAFSDPPNRPAIETPGSRAIPIPVEDGHVSVDLPTGSRNTRWLVIVSSLTRERGRFPIVLKVSSTASPRAFRPVPAEPRQSPGLAHSIPPARRTAPEQLPPNEKTFSIMVRAGDPTSASNYVPVRATLRAVGKGVQVYVDTREHDSVDNDRLREIVETFDREILPTSERLRGRADDTDGDGRFTILMSGWLAHLGGGRLAVDGFVRGADLDPAVQPPFGNRCDMLYLSTSLASGPYLKTVMAHEYAHAVTFSYKRRHPPASGSVEEEGWLDEALSHLVEDQHGYSRANIDYRVDAFLAEPERYRLVVDDYFRADLFRSHGHRGATYLFLRWCERQFGPQLVPTLMTSPRRGVANIEHATGRIFSDLYRDWTLSLAQGLFSEGTANDSPPDPQRTYLQATGSVESWEAEGTSSRYFVVDSPNGGAIRLEVDAPGTAALQVTAAPIAPNRAVLELTARRRGRSLVVGVHQASGPPVALDCLTWCDRANPASSRSELRGTSLAKAVGKGRISEGESLRLQAVPVKNLDAEWSFKLRGHDPSGNPVTAWATCLLPTDHQSAEVLPE